MPLKIKETQILYNARGKKTHVLLPFRTYERILEYLEDLEDLKAIDELRDEPDVSLDEIKKRLEKRKR